MSVQYQDAHALNGVTLSIDRGEKIALVGASGAGKSTLLRLLFERTRETGENAALVPQNFALVESLSVFHNVYMAHLRRHNALYNLANLIKPLRCEVQKVLPVLVHVELEDKLYEPAGQLSGGQQQRTAVARALHQGAPALLGDEPVSCVDEHQSKRLMEIMTSVHQTVVLAMHDTALALEYTERVIGLVDGRVVLDRPTRAIRPDDLSEFYAE